MASQSTSRLRWLSVILGVPLLILILPLLIVIIALYLIAGFLLQIAVWCWWCTRGRDVLLVYSNSPIWQSYVEEMLLPRLSHRAIVLNWSQRRKWTPSLAVLAFRYFGGSREFNPMAIVFRPFRPARSFRFYKPFRDFKHGKTEAVDKIAEQLFALLDGHKSSAA
jgi:hypothetical protein